MVMPYYLQRLPAEALAVLRLMQRWDGVTPAQMEAGAGLSSRLVGRAVRRLINFDLIEVRGSAYFLTTDGKIMVRQLAEYDAGVIPAPSKPEPLPGTLRRLTAVTPYAVAANASTEIFIGVNPPAPDDPRLPESIQLELRVSAIGGTLSNPNLMLSVPPDKAAAPGKVILTPAMPGRPVRVCVDAFQTIDIDRAEALGGMYFDVNVPAEGNMVEPAMRAVSMDLKLKTSRWG